MSKEPDLNKSTGSIGEDKSKKPRRAVGHRNLSTALDGFVVGKEQRTFSVAEALGITARAGTNVTDAKKNGSNRNIKRHTKSQSHKSTLTSINKREKVGTKKLAHSTPNASIARRKRSKVRPSPIAQSEPVTEKEIMATEPGETEYAAFNHAWLQLEDLEERLLQGTDDFSGEQLLELVHKKLRSASFLPRRPSMLDRFQIPKSYDGPVVPEKITASSIKDMLHAFVNSKPLHYKYAWYLTVVVKKILEKEPNVLRVTVPKNGRVIVVGDIHGQLIDLDTVIKKNGLPSPTQHYIFNGDFVDRGPQGPEVLWILYALKIAYPKYVNLHRGNHELRRLNMRYNFETQMRKHYDTKLFESVQATFMELPIASLIEGKVFILHGGLPAFIPKLKDYASANRHVDIPKSKFCHTQELKLLEATLWSDPRHIQGTEKSQRGAGVYFGKDITKSFFKDSGIELLVRSHEVCALGYEFCHDDRVLTIFSASCYCGLNDNKGAVAIFEFGGKLTRPIFKTYTAAIDIGHFDKENHKQIQKTQTLKKLREHIFHMRRQLTTAFKSCDNDDDGVITVTQWAECMKNVLRLPIQWIQLQPYLAYTSGDQELRYLEFLDRYEIKVDDALYFKFERMTIKKICTRIMRQYGNLDAAFSAWDQNNTGKLYYDRFIDALYKLDLDLSKDQLWDFVRGIDAASVGHFTVREIKARFKTEWHRTVSTQDVPWIEEAIEVMAKRMQHSKLDPQKMYIKFAMSPTSGISYKKFGIGLSYLRIKNDYSKAERHKIFSYINKGENGHISQDEFNHAFFTKKSVPLAASRPKLQRGQSMLNFVDNNLINKIHKLRFQLRNIFRHLDVDNQERLTITEIKATIMAFEEKHRDPSKRLTEREIDLLLSSLPKYGSLLLPFFLFGAFRIFFCFLCSCIPAFLAGLLFRDTLNTSKFS